MPSEEITTSDDEGSRHAAPRRPLLRRLQMPVGKAIALAAMPTAALMGVGFGSPLAARAEQQPENPFQDGPCVEMSDETPAEEPEEPEEPAEEETEEPAPEETEEPAEPEEEPAEEPTTEPTGDAAADQSEPEPEAETEPVEGETETGAEAGEEEPAEGEEPNPWDPLGLGESLEDLGDTIGDILTPGRDEQPEDPVDPEDPEESEEPQQPEEPQEPEESEPEAVQPPAEAEEPEETEEPSAEETPEAETEPAEEEEDAEAEEGEPVEVETVDPLAPDEQGRLPFPCPEELSVPGTDEQTALVLPDEPWYLDATSLTLRGLDYHGVVNVTTANGTVKQVLKFTAEKIDIGDLHQIVDAPDGVRYHIGTEPGSNSTFRGGTVTMYTERLEGNLFGVIPVVFDPEHQPPLDLPIAYFTDVFVTQAGQFGGTLTMRGMTSYMTNDGPTTVG
ncbi:hypothetical protein E1265_02970 [Streptomyces sp. 8K308]|uniref:hypothetical protein n=1 Tax=Streptomyces sp. 8K308 TaxID=2530388 RepID=UPI00104BB4A6|nr:hypothetical protein [Streptomyces sp. 8K308]TDC26966.1 hypothetical protein E1265_02970 [Streptomyces sp. 8K308]